MQNDLSKLPAPPAGQQGVTFASLQHLPPPPQGQQGMTLDEIKKQGRLDLSQQVQQAQVESDKANSPMTIAKETIGGAASALFSGAKKFVNSALSAPIDLARGAMGNAPMDRNTIQSDAYKNTGKVYEGQMSPLRATGQATADTVLGAADVLGAEGLLRTGITKGVPLVKRGVNALSETRTAMRGAGAVGDTINQTGKISDMIAPKPTNTQAKLAQSEGRIIAGKEPTLLRSGTPDTVIPSSKTRSASETIVNAIPNASKMTPQELYTAVDNHIGTTAKALRPQMDATPIKPQTIQKINDEWTTLKKTQMVNAPATEEVNVAKRQAKFESLLKKSGNENQGHLWDTRIVYDDSVPTAVKKATSQSSESLQLQREEWLQNRAILNNAINDTKLGMGTKSQRAFSEMTDMYEAKTGLQSKAKIETKAQSSKITQFAKKHPVITATVVGETGRRALTGGF